MKKFIILLVLFMGAGIVLSAQPQFQNATFEINSCTALDCTPEDGLYDCINYWWNWKETENGIDGPTPLMNYDCVPYSACEGTRSLFMDGKTGKATTNNPLKNQNPTAFYAIDLLYMRLPNDAGDPQSPKQVLISGTNVKYDDLSNQPIDLARSIVISTGEEWVCQHTTLPLSSKVLDYSYLQITLPSDIIEETVEMSSLGIEATFSVDDLSLCRFLTFIQQEDCSDEVCFSIDYNPGCLNISSVCIENESPPALIFQILQNGILVSGTSKSVFVEDLPTEICLPLPSTGTYTLDLLLGTIKDPSDCTQNLPTGYFRFDFDYEDRCNVNVVENNQTEIWTPTNTGDNGYLVTGNIIVKSGATLTIEEGVTLAFCKNASLIIERDAQVNLYGKLIACNRKWNGVEVYGLANATTQSGLGIGRLYTYENALIENAVHAVDLFGPTDEHTGGVLIAEGTTFKNFYKSGIRINPFENHSTLSGNITGYAASFNNCNFIIENDFLPMAFWKMVELRGVRGIYFRGCNFENQQDLTRLSLNYYGLGIYAQNSNFKVDYSCSFIVPTGECPHPNRSRFTGLTTGVMVVNTMTEDKGYSIKNSEFRHCETGIYSFASSYGIITQNDFYLGNAHLFEGFDPTMFGVRFYGEQTGFFFEENNFQLDEPENINSNYTIGSFCHDVGETNNYIRLNNYTGLLYGNLANGKNFEDANNGLVYLCNTNDNANMYTYTDDNNTTVTVDGADFGVTDEGIRPNQGFKKVTEFDEIQYYPAGNHFSQTTANSYSDFNNDGGDVIYYYSTHTSSAADEVPVLYSMATIELDPKNKEDECEPREAPSIIIDINDHIVKFTTYKTDWQTDKSSYLTLLDGGDTQVLLQQIATATPGDASLYSDLMAYSPYLSNQVTETLASTAVFTGTDLFNILAANPGVRYNEAFYTNLLISGAGLNFTQILSLQNNQTVSNARTELELSIAYHRQEMDYHANLVIATTLDAEEIADNDFINNWYSSIENKSGAYKKVESLIQKELYTDAQNLLASISAMYKLSGDALTSHNDYVTLSNLMTNIQQAGYQPKDIPTAMLEDVYDIYETATGVAKYKAAALYTAATDELFLEYDLPASSNFIIFLSAEEAGTETVISQSNIEQKRVVFSDIEVYPNPASTEVVFNNLKDVKRLYITDITGRKVANININTSFYKWNTMDINNGIYFYTFYNDSAKVTSGKIVIEK